ncbi:MAG: hypothetical protein ACI97P_002872, partial [Arcticibacterium sp.]
MLKVLKMESIGIKNRNEVLLNLCDKNKHLFL